jgi:hypothetical protein
MRPPAHIYLHFPDERLCACYESTDFGMKINMLHETWRQIHGTPSG